MKKILIVISFFIIIMSCKKQQQLIEDEMGPIPVYFGEASAYCNGELWNFLPHANLDNLGEFDSHLCLEFNIYDNHNFKNKGLGFYYFSKNIGNTKFYKSNPTYIAAGNVYYHMSGYALLEKGGDAIKAYYDVDSTKQCEVNITNVDTATKELWGTFKGTYILDRNATTLPSSTDTIRFTNGTFHTKILY